MGPFGRRDRLPAYLVGRFGGCGPYLRGLGRVPRWPSWPEGCASSYDSLYREKMNKKFTDGVFPLYLA